MLQGGLLGIQASPATLAGEASEDSYGEVGSAFLRNADPTSQLAAHSTTHSHGSAFCCIVCYQKKASLVASRLTLLSEFGREDWDSSSVVGKGFSGPVLTCHISTHTHTRVHACSINMCGNDSWAHGSRWD